MDSVSQVPKVFCVGLGKTGTKSFGALMRKLGYRHVTGPVSEGLALNALGHGADLLPIIRANDSFDDYPYPLMFEFLAETFPDSRFVLTRRSSEHKWLRSLATHNLRMGPTDAFWLAYGTYTVGGQEDRLTRHYLEHNARVREYFEGTGRLIEICWEEPGEGERLLDFLGIPGTVPEIPHENSAGKFAPEAVVDRLCSQKRYGAALAYAQTLDDPSGCIARIRPRVMFDVGTWEDWYLSGKTDPLTRLRRYMRRKTMETDLRR